MILANTGMLVLAIIIIVLLIASFFITYLINKKTPIPKGCEEIAYNVQNCSGCKQYACEYHIRAAEALEKMKEEMKEEQE